MLSETNGILNKKIHNLREPVKKNWIPQAIKKRIKKKLIFTNMHSLEKYKKVYNEVFVDDWLFCLRELKKPQPCLKSSSSSQQCCFYVGWATVVARTPAKKQIRVFQSTQPMVISSR